MEFSEKIKSLRLKNNLTQEEFASKLNVTRQAVSNWENNRNLPDIEMIISIASVFEISLDELILGGKNMNDITKKLIDDTSETKRARFNMISTIIGASLLILGVIFLLIKFKSVEYVDKSGILHENFYLVIIGYLCLFSGFATIFVSWIITLVKKLNS